MTRILTVAAAQLGPIQRDESRASAVARMVELMRQAKSHGADRLEAACERALEIGARSYTSVNSILKNNLDRRRPEPATDGPAISHANIRGPGYFH